MNASAHTATACIRHNTHGRSAGRLSAIEIAVVVLAAVTLVACALISTGRQGSVPSVESITVRVSESDTLWEIAQNHPVGGLSTAQTVALIRDLNHMSTSAIVAGETLRVPSDPAVGTAMASR